MITAVQMRAARALLGIDQSQLAQLAGLSLPTIQRMEASQGVVRGTIGTAIKVMRALEHAGLELIETGAASRGTGRGVRFLMTHHVTKPRDHKKARQARRDVPVGS